MKRMLGWLLMMCLMAACSDPEQGPPLGPFPAIIKTVSDKPFDIVAPSSRSPAPFTFTSSNPAVATIAGTQVTITGIGTTTITATQPAIGSYGPTSASTTLTVTAAGTATGATAFTSGSLQWMGVSNVDTWAKARDFCANSTIEGTTKWRQPTQAELTDLQKSGAIAGHGWTLGATWSSTAGKSASTNHVVVDLSSGTVVERSDTDSAYVSCVR